MKPARIIVIVASALLLVAFFLPWVHVFFGSISAFDILTHNISKTPWKAHVLWLFPLSAIANIILAAISTKMSIIARLLRLIPFIIILTAFVWTAMKDGDRLAVSSDALFKVIGIGVYITLLSSIALLVTAFAKESQSFPAFNAMSVANVDETPETEA